MTTPRTALEECLRKCAELRTSLSDAARRNTYEQLRLLSAELIEEHGKALSEALGGWLPIETAPKDGTTCIVTNGAAVGEAWYSADNDGWWWAQTHPTDAIDGYVWDPTHWRPLPPPPTCAKESEVEGG